MPNRILREGINSSRSIAALSDQAEILYRRLMSAVDDYGRMEADMDLIRAKCFPVQLERWSTARIKKTFLELGGSPLITVYHGAGKVLLQLNNFGQRVQSKPKYPGPDECDENKGEPFSTVPHGDSPESTAYTESESYTLLALDRFDEFWDLYPRKKSKPDAQKAWRKVRNQADDIIGGLKLHLPGLLSRELEFRPYPATWLNKEEWKDPIHQPPAQKPEYDPMEDL